MMWRRGNDETFDLPVRVIGLLLALQVAGLAALGLYEFFSVDWQGFDPLSPFSSGLAEAAAVALFAPATILLLLAAFGFLVLQRRGWLLAAIGEGATLAAGLWIYVVLEPFYVYPIMAYAVLMVLYLNSHDIREAFHLGRDARPHTGGSS